MTNLYSVTLTPVENDSDKSGLPKEIAFIARCHGAPDKRWNLASGKAAIALSSLFSLRAVSQIEARLGSCESITLPKIYGATELVQMGYRMDLNTRN